MPPLLMIHYVIIFKPYNAHLTEITLTNINICFSDYCN